jgi:hypothetical protein
MPGDATVYRELNRVNIGEVRCVAYILGIVIDKYNLGIWI